MEYRIDSLFQFLADEFGKTKVASDNLLSETNLRNTVEMGDYGSLSELKTDIYVVYRSLGFDHAKGMFQETVVESFKQQQ